MGTVFADGVNVNRQQVADGYAWVYSQYARKLLNSFDLGRLRVAEATARTKRLGLWADTQPVAPWEYRSQSTRAVKARP